MRIQLKTHARKLLWNKKRKLSRTAIGAPQKPRTTPAAARRRRTKPRPVVEVTLACYLPLVHNLEKASADSYTILSYSIRIMATTPNIRMTNSQRSNNYTQLKQILQLVLKVDPFLLEAEVEPQSSLHPHSLSWHRLRFDKLTTRNTCKNIPYGSGFQ